MPLSAFSTLFQEQLKGVSMDYVLDDLITFYKVVIAADGMPISGIDPVVLGRGFVKCSS